VRRDNRLHLKFVASKNVGDLLDIFARIDDNGVLRLLIANDDAVALERPHGKMLKNQDRRCVCVVARAALPHTKVSR
jgi:hypothetical protein